mmetsp:Transcript_24654/g.44510  ORF Transcript_24654/g.44510 Transcript_24654/m.44510 type:complete len:126 (+) Transcript_24654:175-552(+)|eukprot:CAMPEP_0201601670 /NCGR_PEP_ID=MMETSP0492-20130828/2592_1 /ASSEMBLY_ACC=CAM_ASM_000837 /TAXON_ID=420259 /ORGANISM="Thalassiosira gravida, Strain GMp14c1" /LENGTH=125 /DNA_ID=CAMNT_0048064973 /DNA_START=231 /DNA_END=608 /DNA_ORIENTATION=+
MKNPVNRLATAAPRALDSLLGGTKSQNSREEAATKNRSGRDRTRSFDLDLSGLNLDGNGGSVAAGGGSVGDGGGSIAEEGGSVVTFEELSELSRELSLDWNAGSSGMDAAPSGGVPSSSGTPSPN